jgi:biotin synthase-related radical SAM superfamily protein
MSQTDAERAKVLARNLMEILTSYEEELMTLERAAPAIGQLRRAVGITIAEACYLITDQGLMQTEWAPPADRPAGRT